MGVTCSQIINQGNTSMAEREFVDYLIDLLDVMDKAQGFTTGLDYETFRDDDKTLFAVVRALEIVGEAVKHIPDSVREENPDIPWKDMAGMRDVLIHDYFSVDAQTIWLTVTKKIPQVKPLIEKMLEELSND